MGPEEGPSKSPRRRGAFSPSGPGGLFTTLIDKPGQKFSGEELTNLHDIPNGIYGVAGVLSWPGRYLVKLGRELHFKAEPNVEGGSSYWMEPELADLFRQARDAS